MGESLTPEAAVVGPSTLGDARISPDGTRIVYSLSTTTPDTRRIAVQLWSCGLNGDAKVRLTHTGEQNRAGRWSPDGRSLAFISNRVARSGVFVLPMTTPGEAREVVRERGDIVDLAWSPDGTRIAYVMVVDPDNPDGLEAAPGSLPPVRVTRRLDYKADGPGYLGERRRQIFVVHSDGGARRQLTSASVDHSQPVWSPDGRWLAVQVAIPEAQGSQLGLIDLQSADLPVRLVGPESGVVGMYAWSPKGDQMLFAGDTVLTGQLDFFVYDTANQRVRRLTTDLACLPDAGRLGQAPPAPPVWLDDRRAVFNAFRAGGSELNVIDTQTGSVERITSSSALHAGLSLDAAGRFIVQTRSSLDGPAEIYVYDRERADAQSISAYNRDLLETYPAALWAQFEVQRAGLTIEAWLLKPFDFDPARQYPMVLDVHGGPQGFHGYDFDPVQQLLAAQGFLVVFCNPRGSVTYGRTFTRHVWQDWGGEDYLDLMAVVDAALERPYVDRERLGIYGSSYGGYMTAWAITQTRRFKAAVSRAPVFDLESFYGTSDIGYTWSTRQFGGPPHERRDWYAARSPSTFAHCATTRTLIIHGESDDRCPIGQGEQMFVTLKKAGCTAEFVRYPGSSHLFFRPGGPPAYRIDFLERVLGWFKAYLGEPRES
jgi:dipeptidyl aminopeptidase/acylaminoacyl peptidase